MLTFERAVVAALLDPGIDTPHRDAIERFVDDSLRDMPEYLRFGVATESVVLGAWARARGRGDGTRLRGQLDRWRTNPLDPIRQYVRMFESLVTFARHELEPAA